MAKGGATEPQKEMIKSVFPSMRSIELENDPIDLRTKLKTIGLDSIQVDNITSIEEAKKIARSLAEAANVPQN